MHKDFTFRNAYDILEYLNDLGISTVYCSPYFHARPGSNHGYDIANYNNINPEISAKITLEQFALKISEKNLGQMVDFVPNHMAFSNGNEWLMDVFEFGYCSPYAHFFDISWDALTERQQKENLQGKVMVPVLEDIYDNVLGANKILLYLKKGKLYSKYYDNVFPINSDGYNVISELLVEKLQITYPNNESTEKISSEIVNLKVIYARELDLITLKIKKKHKQKSKIYAIDKEFKSNLTKLFDRPEVRQILKSLIENLNENNDKGLQIRDAIFKMQFYKLSYWRLASTTLNYRRFFDINDLISIRVEDGDVFQHTHKLLFSILSTLGLDGIRVDHPDGLWDPKNYFIRLQRNCQDKLKQQYHGDIDQIPTTSDKFYILAEKILMRHEELDRTWPISGTTGYDFLNEVNGLFVDKSNELLLSKIYFSFIKKYYNFQDIVYEKKKYIVENFMMAELETLALLAKDIANNFDKDFSFPDLCQSIKSIVSSFPIYRTYITLDDRPTEKQLYYINIAIDEAIKRNTQFQIFAIIIFIGHILRQDLSCRQKTINNKIIKFIMKFQQLTSPVMAKGLEDSAFYVYNRLISLNEVGGDPEYFGNSVNTFHNGMINRAKNWPHSMLSSSTHDTKRSEDVRARINIISEMPDEWHDCVGYWSRLNRKYKINVDGSVFPDRNDEYLFYQTLIGSWPFEWQEHKAYDDYIKRIISYMIKAVRESKTHTTWTNQNRNYESALESFIQNVLDKEENREFINSFIDLYKNISFYGMLNSITQLILKLTAPGVPDIYQGNEIWNFSLVDPDNRRPVDYKLRKKMLYDIKNDMTDLGFGKAFGNYLDKMHNGKIKMYVTIKLLTYRKNKSNLFLHGEYIPLVIVGQYSKNVVAFVRHISEDFCIVIISRFLTGLNKESIEIPLHNTWEKTFLLLPKKYGNIKLQSLITNKFINLNDIASSDIPARLNLQSYYLIPMSNIFTNFCNEVLVKSNLNEQ